METINITEKEVSKMFQIPLNALKRCRSEKKFDINICFTPPYSHRKTTWLLWW